VRSAARGPAAAAGAALLVAGCGAILGIDDIAYAPEAEEAGARTIDGALEGGAPPGPDDARVTESDADDSAAGNDSAAMNDARPDGPFTLLEGLTAPEALVVDDTSLYWVSVAGGGVGSIQRAAKDGTGAVSTLAGNQPSPLDIALEGATLYWSVNQTPPASATAAQCLAMTAQTDGGAATCVTSGPYGSVRMTVTGAYVVVLAQPAGAGPPPQQIGYALADGGYASEPTQGASQAIAATPQNILVGNINGPHIDQLPLPALGNFGPMLCTTGCGGSQITDMVLDTAGTSPLWVSQFGGVFTMSTPPIAAATATHLAELGQTPQRLARDQSYVYVTTTSSVFAVPIVPLDGGLTALTLASGEASPFGVAVDSAYVYWTDGSGKIRATSVPPPP
jgi:hypothetical protein